MKISKPNPDWKVLGKDLKAIKQLFHVNPDRVMFKFFGYAIDAKTKECIFGKSGLMCSTWKYTERCTTGIMYYASDVDGAPCWIIPDENYSFDVEYHF